LPDKDLDVVPVRVEFDILTGMFLRNVGEAAHSQAAPTQSMLSSDV
jgi:hypothetical protein